MPILEKIFNQNPWWQDKAFIQMDPKIKEFNAQNLRHHPSLLAEFDLSSFKIYTLRGPRQVGKTTTVKLLIRKLLDEGKSPASIFFYSCDNLDDYHDLIDLLETYRSWLKKRGTQEPLICVFLDEVTTLPDWQRGIKYLADQGSLEDTVMILTGSNAIDLRKGVERLPGRRGRGVDLDKILLPLSFQEYLKLIKPAFFNQITSREKTGQGLLSRLTSQLIYLKDLQLLFDGYLLSGGFPRAINAAQDETGLSFDVYEVYRHWIRGDMAKLGKSERTARQIIGELLKAQTTALGWETIARKTDVASHKTVAEYVEALEDFFVLKVLYQVDMSSKLPKVKKYKKIYLLDVFILWSLWGWIENWPDPLEKAKILVEDANVKGKLVEIAVANHLFGIFDRKEWTSSRVYFWRDAGEIDFLVKVESGLLPIEVKHQKEVDFRDFKSIQKLGFRRGILISQNVLEKQDGFFIIPLELFLLNIELLENLELIRSEGTRQESAPSEKGTEI
ncbi:MAG: ATP-binding protein [bacterium]